MPIPAFWISSVQKIHADDFFVKRIEEVAKLIANAFENGHRLYLCGNGGSAADAQHLAAEFTGRFIKDRPPVAAIALSTDTSALTCIANDYSFDAIFARQVQAIGKPGDCLIAISTSGNSGNVLAGTFGWTANTVHEVTTSAIGVKSRIGSYW